MSPEVTLRPLAAGELPLVVPPMPDSEFDDFGPRVPQDPPPSRMDADGSLGVFADGRLVGTVGWHWLQWGPNAASRSSMIGIWLAEAGRGQGVGTEAQRQVVDLVFRHTAVNRVEAHTDVENVAEQRALEKVGFTREGVIRGSQWRDGAFHDGYLYSLLRAEWESR